MTKGILLIALGHEQYKQMAFALAASIRVNDPDVLVAIATDKPFDVKFSFLFSHQIILDEKSYTVAGKKEYIRAKLCAYEISPFDETIFLDVDQILLPKRKISVLFDELAEVEFTMSNTGLAGTSVWVDIEEVKRVYGSDQPFWNYHSELVYFKKCATAKKYFTTAKKVYDKANLTTAFKFAGGRMADELAFQIASIITGTYPHKDNWTPNFWYVRNPKLSGKYPYQLEEFITYSIGGAFVPMHIRTHYNNLAASYFYRLKLQNPYKAKDKRSFLPERVKY